MELKTCVWPIMYLTRSLGYKMLMLLHFFTFWVFYMFMVDDGSGRCQNYREPSIRKLIGTAHIRLRNLENSP